MLQFTQYIDEGLYDQARRKAIFLAGGPGSGKSYVAQRTTQGLGFKHVNSDEMFEKGLDRAGLAKTPENIYSDQGQKIRERAKELTAQKEKIYREGRLGMIIDGTGKDPEKIQAHSDRLRKLGYDTHMVFVNTSLDTALARNRQRDRTLPDTHVADMHAQVQNNLGHFQQHFGSNNMHIVDNDYADEHALFQVHKKIRAIASAPVRNPIGKKEDMKLKAGLSQK